MTDLTKKILDSNFSIVSSNETLVSLVEQYESDPKIFDEIESLDPLIYVFIKWKLYEKSFAGDFQSIKLTLEKVNKQETEVREEVQTTARMPLPNEKGEFVPSVRIG